MRAVRKRKPTVQICLGWLPRLRCCLGEACRVAHVLRGRVEPEAELFSKACPSDWLGHMSVHPWMEAGVRSGHDDVQRRQVRDGVHCRDTLTVNEDVVNPF